MDDEIVGLIAIQLWRAFEYDLPVSPRMMSEFVFRQINEAGYEVIKRGKE